MSEPAFTPAERLRIVQEHMDEHGGVFRPHEFVDSARSPNHPAHAWFVWNNDEAGEAFRLWQARQFPKVRIKHEAVETVNVSDGKTTIEVAPMPAFVSPIPNRASGGGYVSTETSAGQAALREEAAAMLQSWLNRFRGVLSDDAEKMAGRLLRKISP